MKAIFIEEPGKIGFWNIDRPSLAEDEVLIRVDYAGICGSDLHIFNGKHAFRKPPIIPGHEILGTVEKLGKDVSRLKVGDIVTVLPKIMCEKCELCRRGVPEQCLNKRQPGTPAWIGGFVEYFNVPEEFAYKIPETMEPILGVLAEPLGVSLHAVKRCMTSRTLLILGCGALGTFALVVARLLGFEKIVVTDAVPYNLENALKFGADAAINAVQEDVEVVSAKAFGPIGPDSVLITASASNILDQALRTVTRAGTVVFLPMIAAPLTFDSLPIMMKQITIKGSSSFNKEDFAESISLLNGHQDLFKKLITQVYRYQNAQEAFNMMVRKEQGYIKVVLDFHKG